MAPWLATVLVALWVCAIFLPGTAQWGDNIEQFVWAHSLEWGYHKHPPMPTWLLAVAIGIGGQSTAWAVVLGGACTALTGWITYRIAQRILGNPWAALALLLWGLQQAFSTRSGLFNHNTVMMLAVAVTVWSVLCALAAQGRSSWWLLSGLSACAAILSKYQAIIPLAGILLALLLNGELASRANRCGVLLAASVVALGVLPHIIWVVAHDFSTFKYAGQIGITLSLFERVHTVLSFLAQQVRLLFPALLLAGLLLVVGGGARAVVAVGLAETDRARRAWFIGLIGFPLLATVLVGPLLGLELQNHWGFQCLQFASLCLAHLLRARAPASVGTWIALALLAHGTFMVTGARASASGTRVDRRADAYYPAPQLAGTIARDWRDATPCSLRIVVGPSFEAGIVSVYNGGEARVLEDGDFGKSPWINAADLEREGAVYLAHEAGNLPTKGAAVVGFLDVSSVSPAPTHRIYWAIVPPKRCDVTADS